MSDGTEWLIHKPKGGMEWIMQRPHEEEPDNYNDDLDAVLEAWSQLTLEESDILQAIFHERLSYEELGERLGVSKPHAWRRTQAALAKVRALLEANDPTISHRYEEQ